MIPDSLIAQAAAADSAALAAAASSAEEALGCHRDALAALAAGWHSETGSDAIELLQRQCAQATDIVSELHRAAGELRSLHDDLAELSGGTTHACPADAGEQPPAEACGSEARVPVSGPLGDGPASQPDPPAAVPGPSVAPAPWAAQAGAGPWTAAPSTMPQPSPTWQPGGSTPGLPDLGGALVGLVAQIAQTLGPYADAPGPVPAEHPVEKPPPPAEAEPRPPHRKPRLPVTSSPAAPPIPPHSAVPKSIAPQTQTQTQTQTQPPAPELLAAERPPDPGVPPEPPPPVSAAPPQPPPAPVAPPPPAAETKTPCEIAADELPKVGE